jgi:hypothetical protein
MATLPYSTTTPHCPKPRAKRLSDRLYLAIAAALVIATMAYGESWLLEDAPRATLECAVTSSVAHAFNEPVAAN